MKVSTIKKKIEILEQKIQKIQDSCPHPKEKTTETYGANTGNPFEANLYWTDYFCQVCEKEWTVNNQDNNY